MRLIVLIPLIILGLFSFGSFMQVNNELGEFGTHQFIFRKYDTQKSLSLYLIKQEFVGTKYAEDDQYNRSNIHSNDHRISWGHLYFESSRSGLSTCISSLNLMNLRINVYTNYFVFFNGRNLNV